MSPMRTGAKWPSAPSSDSPKIRAKKRAAAALSRAGTMVWFRVIAMARSSSTPVGVQFLVQICTPTSFFCVFAGLDPAIHGASGAMDPRIKSAGDAFARQFPRRNGRKKSRTSCASASGCSIAAKCPPRGITLQRRMSLYMRAATERGGRRISAGNWQ